MNQAGTLTLPAMNAKLPTVVIVGRPNVGKSTFFNRLVGKRVAVVEDEPGITRDRLYAEAEWRKRRFTVVDTGGILFSDDDPLIEQIRTQAQVALAEADVIILLVDGGQGLHPDDMELANRLRGVKKPLFVVANKADNPSRTAMAPEFYGLGLGDVFAISSIHGRGISDLMDAVVEGFPATVDVGESKEEIRLAIVGRPNVGKSSMLNAFTGEVRSIVSDLPGTTRDAIDTLIEYKGETFRLIDTAGLRRRGKIQGTVEYYMAMRSTQAIDRCHCALIVVDGDEGLTDGDKRIAKMAHDQGRACVVAINKWDLVDPPDGQPKKSSPAKKAFLKQFRDEFPELSYAEICFTSAKETAGLEPVLDRVLKALESWNFRVSTGRLNRIVQDAVDRRPYSTKGKSLRIYYCTQVDSRPPTFVLFCNDPDIVHFSYQRYLENQLRKEFGLTGTPIRLTARSSRERD